MVTRLQAARVLAFAAILMSAACAPYAPTAPILAGAAPGAVPLGTPGAAEAPPDPATFIEVPPFPYSTPLPPAVPSAVDGLYTRTVPFEGTPVPCRRCAGYRIEGGEWTLYLDRGVFKVYQPATGFAAVGSFAVSGDHLTLFNDPYCEEDLRMVGTYTWTLDGNGLRLNVINDPCSIGLRARNLTATAWSRVERKQSQNANPCQPPNREAAISDHWPKPAGCQ